MAILISQSSYRNLCQPSRLVLYYFGKYLFCSKTATRAEIAQCFVTLGVAVNSDQATVRQAFLDLVKRYHPDSKSPEANPYKFQQVENAFRTLQEQFAQDRVNVDEGLGEYGLYHDKNEDEIDHPDIQHTAPQHRQYLSWEGVGSGTPTQRYRHYVKLRAAKAVENVTHYRIKKLLEEEGDPHEKQLMKKENKKKVKDIRTGLGMDRLVEDLIQESISKGEFDNLAGKGKPLNFQSTSHSNPYVDFVTHKMNQVLIDNGFTPMWITLQKEIREDSKELRQRLLELRASLGPLPLSPSESRHWAEIERIMAEEVRLINSKIDSYNLQVPLLHQQMFHLNIEQECENALRNGTPKQSPTEHDISQTEHNSEQQTNKGKRSFRKLLASIFS